MQKSALKVLKEHSRNILRRSQAPRTGSTESVSRSRISIYWPELLYWVSSWNIALLTLSKESIYDNKKECRVLIGFLGASGAGKSSLINALLEQDDLLPADDEKACTAVCVEIAYNPSENSNLEFTAKVDRISEDDWRVELGTLFKDLKDQAQSTAPSLLNHT